MPQTVVNITNVATLVFCQAWVCISMTPFRTSVRKASLVIGTVTAAGLLLYALTVYLAGLQTAINLQAVYFVPTFFAVLSQGKYRDGRLFFSFFFTDFSLGVASLSTFLLCFPTSIGTDFRLYGIIIKVVAILSATLMVIFVAPRVKMMFEYGNSKVWWPVGLAATIAFLFMCFMAGYPEPLQFRMQDLLVTALTSTILIVLFLVLIIAISEMCKSEEQKKQFLRTQAALDISQLQIQQSERQYEGILENIDTVRRINHDLRHHLLAMEGLCKAGDIDKVSQYIAMLSDKIPSASIVRHSNIFEADVILSHYADLFDVSGIRYSFTLQRSEHVPQNPIPLCVILGNALENALEACRKMPKEDDRFVTVEGKMTENHQAILRITNSYREDVRTDCEGNIITTKDDSNLHGFGLENIRLMTAENNGWCEFSHEDSTFEMKAVFQL